MNESTKTLEVTIFNHKLTLRCSGDDESYFLDLAKYVDDFMNSVALKNASNHSDIIIAILSSLVMADDFKKQILKSKADIEKANNINTSIANKSIELIDMITSVD